MANGQLLLPYDEKVEHVKRPSAKKQFNGVWKNFRDDDYTTIRRKNKKTKEPSTFFFFLGWVFRLLQKKSNFSKIDTKHEPRKWCCRFEEIPASGHLTAGRNWIGDFSADGTKRSSNNREAMTAAYWHVANSHILRDTPNKGNFKIVCLPLT